MPVARVGLLISALIFASLRAPAQQSSAQMPAAPPAAAPDSTESLPTIRVTSRLVILDIVVSDGHLHPARGLTASDFKLTEDGVPQAIDSFTEHDAPPNPSTPETQPLPPNTFAVQPPVTGNGVMTVIVLGSFGPFIRDQLRSYFQTAPLTTPIAIFRIGGGMHLIQGFTTDRNVLLEAANSQRIWPVLGPRFHSDPASFRISAIGSPTQHLAAYLAGIPGRINIIWIGGGPPVGQITNDFPDESDSLASVTQMVGDLNRTTDVRRLGRVALYAVLTGNSCLALGTNDIVDRVNKAGGRGFRCTDPKPAMEQIADTGAHYYTISYHPTNPDWNGAYRRIHLDVAGYAQPPLTLRWTQLITGWADDVEPTLLYRQGYFARSTPPRDARPDFDTTTLVSTTPDLTAKIGPRVPLAPQRRLISISPKGAFSGAFSAQVQAAIAFGSLTPFDLHFAIAVDPAPEREKIKGHDPLPSGNFLTTPFRDGPYRNDHIHYWIDPRDLHFIRTPSGLYHDDLKTIAVVYRDDGITANSLTTTTHLDLSADDFESIQASGITLDQTIAIPTTEHFFLRALVSEDSTKRIGALEIPVEWIKLPQPNVQIASKPAP